MSTVYALESRLVSIWMVHESRFRNLKRVDGTTQEFVSGTFRVCKFQVCLPSKYLLHSLELENKSFDFPWIRMLFMYWSPDLFLWMVQRKFRFRNLKRVDGTTQEFVSCTFRSVNSKAAYGLLA